MIQSTRENRKFCKKWIFGFFNIIKEEFLFGVRTAIILFLFGVGIIIMKNTFQISINACWRMCATENIDRVHRTSWLCTGNRFHDLAVLSDSLYLRSLSCAVI